MQYFFAAQRSIELSQGCPPLKVIYSRMNRSFSGVEGNGVSQQALRHDATLTIRRKKGTVINGLDVPARAAVHVRPP